MNEARIASRMPYVVDVEKGKTYWWCACGRSATQPYCDGSHQVSGISPLQFTATRSEKIWLCGCKRSQRPPLCDGRHNRLPPEPASGG
jgi:CDGSH iron-sulfur domain-containing protein 3